MDKLPKIPIEDLFQMMEYPCNKTPLRWWSFKTAQNYLGVSERTLRRYKAEGKLEFQYKKKGSRVGIYFTNRSVINLHSDRVPTKIRNAEGNEV